MSIIGYRDYCDRRVKELGIASMYPTDFFDRMLAAKRIVDTLKEWCENQGYALCNDYIRDDDVVRFDIAYMGRTGHYHFELCQINDFDDVEKGIKNTMEHFENNYGKRAEFAETHHLPVGIVREVTKKIPYEWQRQMVKHLLNSQHGLASRNIPMVAARCLPKSLQNTIYGMVTGSVPMSNEVREALNYFKEVNDSMFKRIPDITKVIHNAPATIVFWSDGEKTVVKAENEVYDPEKGIAMAITKKVLGNKGNYYNTIRKWLPKEEE